MFSFPWSKRNRRTSLPHQFKLEKLQVHWTVFSIDDDSMEANEVKGWGNVVLLWGDLSGSASRILDSSKAQNTEDASVVLEISAWRIITFWKIQHLNVCRFENWHRSSWIKILLSAEKWEDLVMILQIGSNLIQVCLCIPCLHEFCLNSPCQFYGENDPSNS